MHTPNFYIYLALALQKDLGLLAEASDLLVRQAIKREWPTEVGTFAVLSSPQKCAQPECCIAHVVREYRLQHMALESPDIDGNDSQAAEDSLKWNACNVWQRTFRQDLLRLLQTRSVRRHGLPPSLYEGRSIDIFGREVHELMVKRPSWLQRLLGQTIPGYPLVTNPKFRKAAQQFIRFDPDSVHFMFPDLKNWAGHVSFHESPFGDTDCLACKQMEDDHRDWVQKMRANCPDCEGTGVLIKVPTRKFYRATFSYAAKPLRTDRGEVITMVPPGLRGLIYFCIWKLARFIP
jgi:hypothetical protein